MEPGDDAEDPTASETARAWEALLEADAERRSLGEALEIPTGVIQRAEMVGYRLYRQGDYERAKTIASGIIALDGERIYAHLLLGDISLTQIRESSEDDQYDAEQRDWMRDARHSLERVLEIEPEHHAAKVKLARLHIRRGNWESADALLSHVRDSTADDALRSEADVLSEVVKSALGSTERADH